MVTREFTDPHPLPQGDDNQAAMPEAPSQPSAPPMTGAEVKGYRTLTAEEIGLLNEIKAVESATMRLWLSLMRRKDTDTRWLAIGRTNLQLGFMAICRAIAKPFDESDPRNHDNDKA